MVLDFAIEDMGIKQRRMSLSSIARVLRTNKISGTIRENIELINAELEDSVPRIHFYSRVSARFDDIKDEIDSCRPVIAWINIAPSKEDTVMHAVVIVGYDLQQNEIFLVDPEMTQENHEKHMDLGMFLDEKLGVEGRIIILSVSEIGQKHLNGRITPYQRRRNS